MSEMPAALWKYLNPDRTAIVLCRSPTSHTSRRSAAAIPSEPNTGILDRIAESRVNLPYVRAYRSVKPSPRSELSTKRAVPADRA